MGVLPPSGRIAVRGSGSVRSRNAPARAVIYARYSSTNQREESIEDQIEVCRRYIDRQGWELANTYDDRAISGASQFRPGYQRLLQDAETGCFEVVVCEAIDRLSRKLSDVASLFDTLQFRSVRLHAANLGEVTPLHVGIMGTMAQMFLSELGDKTLRGQLGRARQGKIPGGLAYGYEVVNPNGSRTGGGERRIREDEAAVVRRIFDLYLRGCSARRIAHDLNAEGVPGPGGRPWGDTTIRGQADRGTGLLNNTLYIGRLCWNRCSYVKDPRTGRRVARINAEDQREVVEVPELRIVDQETRDRTHERQQQQRFRMARDGSGNALNVAHRQKFLLSGLLNCASCGGSMTIIGRDRYGCATRRIKGTCTNDASITRQRVEARVLSGLRDKLLAPDRVVEAVRTFTEELANAERQAMQDKSRLARQLADADRALSGLLRAIEGGTWSEAIRTRLKETETRKAMLQAEMDALSQLPCAPALHPNAADAYRRQVAELEVALNDPEDRLDAITVLRGLIDKVLLTPDEDVQDGYRIELTGALGEILALSASDVATSVGVGPNKKGPRTIVRGPQLSVVAGTGFEPVTFRL